MAEVKTISFSIDEIGEIEFDGKDERYGNLFLNFSAPKTILGKEFKDADYAELSIVFSGSFINVVVGPVSVEQEGTWVYDQFNVNLSQEDLLYLLNKAGIETEDYLGFIFLYKKRQNYIFCLYTASSQISSPFSAKPTLWK